MPLNTLHQNWKMEADLSDNDFEVIYDGPSTSPGVNSPPPVPSSPHVNAKLIGLTEAREILHSVSLVKIWTSKEDLVDRLREPDWKNYFCNDPTKGKEWSAYWRQVLSRRLLFDGDDALENLSAGLSNENVRDLRKVAKRYCQLQEMQSKSGGQHRNERPREETCGPGISQPESYEARFGSNLNLDTTPVTHRKGCGCFRCLPRCKGRALQSSQLRTPSNDTGGRSPRSSKGGHQRSCRSTTLYRFQNLYTLVDDANLVRAVADTIIDVQKLSGSNNLKRALPYVRSSTWSYQDQGLQSLTDRYNSLPGSNRRTGGSLKNRWQILVQNWANYDVDEQIFNSVEAREMCLEMSRVYIKNCVNCRSPRNTNQK